MFITVQVYHLSKLVHSKMDLKYSLSVTLLVTWCQFILIASQGLNTSSRLIITCSMYSSYNITFWGYRKGSRANSNWEFIVIKLIKYYLLQKIHLQHNSTSLSKFASILESTSRREIRCKSDTRYLGKCLWGVCSSSHSHYSATQARCSSSQLGI